ncbi:MAG: IS21 family transposase [Chlorobiales bacterium]|nr:IS21 family transposase [Chlorobiales bacterium]
MDILAMHRSGLSQRKIAAKLGIHRNTVKRYITDKQPPAYRKNKRRDSILAPYHQIIRDWLDQGDFTATWIFDKLKGLGYCGGYDTVRSFVKQIKARKARQAFIRFETEPARQAQMDWADLKIDTPDGPSRWVYLFTLILGYSRALFAWFVEHCTLETFMDGHIKAFGYLGGVPKEILYDNMKHVVIGRKGRKVTFNHEFVHFAAHYGFTSIACMPYSPWVKGKVERPIDYIRERFWRGYQFESIEQANADLRRWLDRTANCRVHGTHHQPVSERWQHEKVLLTPCPASDYDTAIKVYRKVYKDCLVAYNANRYIVPADVVGKKILLKIKHGTIRFYDDGQLLATYTEPAGKHQIIGNRLFYEQLQRERRARRQHYGRNKGAATTRGLTNASLFPEVMHRPLADYDLVAQGGV